MQRGVGSGEVLDKGTVDADQTVTVVEIGKAKPVFQGKIGHWQRKFHCMRGLRTLLS